MSVKMYNVNSSNIKAIGYEDGNVIVEFKNGTQYAYAAVDEKLFKCFLVSESKGKFFVQHIKNQFECQQLGLKKYRVKMVSETFSGVSYFDVEAGTPEQAKTKAKKLLKEKYSNIGKPSFAVEELS